MRFLSIGLFAITLPLAACQPDNPSINAAKLAWNGDVKALENVLSQGASPDALVDGHPLIRIAMEGRGGELSAGVLLAHGARINLAGDDGITALMEAAAETLERTEYLLQHGADPNQEDAQGNTALFYINSSNGWGAYALGIAHMLVMNGADPCHKNKKGEQARDNENSSARLYITEACQKKIGH